MLFVWDIISIALFLIAIIIFFYGLRSFWKMTFSKDYAPFVPIPENAIHLLCAHIALSSQDIVYDLGCGDGRILVALSKLFPNVKYIGIENGNIPFLIAKWKTRKYKNITILRENFFKSDIRNATVIVMYLFPSLMDLLLPKLERELQKGTKLYSFDFPFSKKDAKNTIELSERKGKLGSLIREYIF